MRSRFVGDYRLGEMDAATLTASKGVAQYFEAVVKIVGEKWTGGGVPKAACNWITGELASHLNDDGIEIDACPVGPEALAELIALSLDGKISNRAAKEVFSAMWKGEGGAGELVESRGLAQVSDEAAIEAIVDAVLAANAKLVDDYRAGREKAFNALVGQVMKASQGKANPAQASAILKRRLA
jgi:aspartyl-tRNA(Asn)/glutamyl-tRNA(Gln) amidotransferase subunit B